MYSGTLPTDLAALYLAYAGHHDKAMKVGMLSGTGPSCCGLQLMTFTSHGFGFGLLQIGDIDRYLLHMYTAAKHSCTRGTCTDSSRDTRSLDAPSTAIRILA